MIPLDLPASGVDAYAGSPHKWVQSPKGLGVLYLAPELHSELRPMWVTWGQSRWAGTVRAFEDYGTRNLPELLALTDAVRFQEEIGQDEKLARYRAMWSRIRERVRSTDGLSWRSPESFEGGASLVAVEVTGRNAGEVGGELLASHRLIARAFGGARLNHIRLSPNVATLDDEIDAVIDLLEAAAR